jgi:hypothetical protein
VNWKEFGRMLSSDRRSEVYHEDTCSRLPLFRQDRAQKYKSKSLLKIRGFHAGDCKGCRLLGYENPVRSSQETHYVSATELSRLMQCKI